MSSPFFSILIPACNMEGKMDKCIASLKNQAFTDFEAIIVDDGSKDGTLKEIQTFEKEDKRFIALSHDGNKSLLAARYTAMKEAKGEYILFLDSDDYISDNTLEKLHGFILEKPVDIVRFGYIEEPDKREILPEDVEDPLRLYMAAKVTPSIWKNAYKKDVIDLLVERTGPFYCNMGEDVYFTGVLFSCAKSFATYREAFYHYVLGEGMSNSKKSFSEEKYKRDMNSAYESGKHLLEFIEKYNSTYVTETKNIVKEMKRFNLFNATMYEPDYCKVIERIKDFDTVELRDIYEWGCRKYLPYLIERRLKRDTETAEEKREAFTKLMQEE